MSICVLVTFWYERLFDINKTIVVQYVLLIYIMSMKTKRDQFF